MNYYPFHIGDYLSKTRHLSWDEDAAYRRLLDVYYASENPLPSDVRAVFRLILASTDAQREAVQIVLNEFFELTDGGWINKRADDEIDAMRQKQQKQREKANKRWHKQNQETGIAAALPQHNEGDATASNLVADAMPPTPTPTPTPTPVLKEKEKTLSGKPDPAAEILAYLNERAGKHFRGVKATITQINARLKEASPDEIRAVIDDRVKAWGRDEKMAQYLRPATLFAASKFAGYLGNLEPDKPASAEQPGYFQGVRIAA